MAESNDNVDKNAEGEGNRNESSTEQKMISDLTKKVTDDVDTKMKDNRALNALLADGDVIALLKAKEAKEAGQNIRIIVGDEEPDNSQKNDNTSENLELDMLDNRQLVDHTRKAVVNDVQDMVKKELQPLAQAVSKMMTDAEDAKVNFGIQKAMEEHPDFMDYKDGMVQVAQGNKELTAEQCYILAKAKAGGTINPQAQTGSEKPDSIFSRPGRDSTINNSRDEKTSLNKRSAFRQLLDKAQDNVMRTKM